MNTMESFSLEYDSKRSLYRTTPVPENLESYYDHPDYISHDDSNDTFFGKIYRIAKSFNIRWKFKSVCNAHKRASSILDVGCGTGSFLYFAKNAGMQIRGVELNPKARTIAKDKLNTSVLSNISQLGQEEKFDIITLWHVLEHLENFESVILKLREHLNPGGLLVIAVPNFNSRDASYYKEYWAAFDVPRHLFHFSRETFQYVSDMANFDLIDEKGMLMDAFYVSLLSEKYKMKKFPWLRAFCIGLYSNLSAIRSKNYSSQVYTLKLAK